MNDWLLALAESGLNRELARRPSALRECAELSGRCLALEVLAGTTWQIYVVPHRGGLQLLSQAPEQLTATVRGTPAALLRAAGGEAGAAGLREAGVELRGDAEFAARLQRLLRRAVPDPEQWLAQVLGDTGAHELASGVRSLVRGLRGAADTLSRDIAEYLQFERGDLPVIDEVSEFVSAVDRLRDDVARLQARVDLLDPDNTRAPGGSRDS